MTESAEQLRAQLAQVIMQQDEEFQFLKRLADQVRALVRTLLHDERGFEPK